MNILLTTLNSKYVHSNLALRYLYSVVADENHHVSVREFTINQDPIDIYTELIRANYDVVCFSCYIWNISKIEKIAADLKKSRPDTLIVCGGPEVSYRGPEFVKKHPWVDFVLCGEGEYSFYRLLQVLDEPEQPFETIPGLIYRKDGKIFVNGKIEPIDMNKIPFPYSMLGCEEDKVVYYESSRGCPFGCTYCLSSIEKSMRSLELERVKTDLSYFLYKKVMQVKFIDRTFNYDRDRAYEIFRYLIENDNQHTNFHFEICADLLDEKTLKLLSKARPGLFQMEVGIQSVNPKTLLAIGRKENVYPILYNVERLVHMKNIHIHVDLIAGLPYETYELFQESFDKVYALGADAFQLGFLKVLQGTPLSLQIDQHEIVYRDYPPYEVISTAYITAEELVKLKMVENMLDIYYNRGGFSYTLDYLIEKVNRGAYGFYWALAEFYYEKGFQLRDRKKDDQYRILYEFSKDLAQKTSDQRIEERTLLRLEKDAEENMNPENLKRFLRKGWEL